MPEPAARFPPVIILGRGYTGLGVLRSLALSGIPAYVACPDGDLATRSRWYRDPPWATPWDGRIDPMTAGVLRAMPLEHAVLIPGADDAALWLADLPVSDLGSRFMASSSSRATLEILQDKARFGDFLSRTGIPHPRTFQINDRSDVRAIPFNELGRVFVKPADSQRFSRSTGIKGVWADDARTFEAIWTGLDARGFKVIAQEYVPGGADQHYFVEGFRDRRGEFTGLFARRRFRIHPPDFGNSSYCQSIPLAQISDAVASVVTLLSSLDYRGIFSAELKRDERDGTFRLLEVNTRAWWYVEFAARCGVNVCQMAFDDARGVPVCAAGDYRAGVGCVNFAGDLRSVLARSPGPRRPLSRALREWMHAYFHVLRLDDPMPAISVGWRGARRWAMKAQGRDATSRSASSDPPRADGCQGVGKTSVRDHPESVDA